MRAAHAARRGASTQESGSERSECCAGHAGTPSEAESSVASKIQIRSAAGRWLRNPGRPKGTGSLLSYSCIMWTEHNAHHAEATAPRNS